MSSINPNDLADTATMTFDDEFNSLSLWNGQTGSASSGTWSTTYIFADPNGNGSSLPSNGEQEWYINNLDSQTSSVKPWTVSNGVLNITADKASSTISPLINNYSYTSGLLETSHSFSQTYGYFEVRAKLPSGQGMWPAFWLLDQNGQWPPELDVFEVLGNNPSALYTTVHSTTLANGYESLNTTVADTSAGFHTYGVDWEADYITWYFDGQAVFREKTPSDMNQPMYMLLNLAVGGSWPGDVNSSTTFPATMQVDWVRAYQSNGSTATETSPSTAVTATGSGTKLAAVGAATNLAVGGAATSAVALPNGQIAVVGNGFANLFGSTGASSGSTISLGGSNATVKALAGGMWQVTDSSGTEVYNSSGTQVFVNNAFVSGSPVFGALGTGGYVEAWTTNTSFMLVDSSGKINWISLPTSTGGSTLTPTAIQSLSDGGFVFSYDGSTQLDRYSYSAGVHTTIQLASAPVGTPSVVGFSDLVTEAAWVNSSGALMLEGFGSTGTALGSAVTVSASGASAAQMQLLATGVHDNSVLLYSNSGTIYAASFNGTSASSSTAIASGSLSAAKDVVLSNGDVAVSWLETDNGVQHAWVEVLDPTTMQVAKHDLGASSGSIDLVALSGGGFAESWHDGGTIDGVAYDGLGDYGAITTVSGDFVGVDSSGEVEAVGVSSSGQATLQDYALSGAASSAATTGSSGGDNFLGGSQGASVLENTAGEVAVGLVNAQGTETYTVVGSLGTEWKFVGSGDYLSLGSGQFMIENTAGAVEVGTVSNGQTTYAKVASLGSEWSFVGSGNFLNDGKTGFLIENTSGQVYEGEVGSNNQATYTKIASLGSEWTFEGSGDYLGKGHDQFLIENTSGKVVLGDLENGQLTWSNVTGLGSEWKFVGSGDYLSDGKSQFLMENAAGSVVVGEVGSNGQVSFTTVAGLGSEWKFVGSGDYLGDGHSQFLVESSSGQLAVGNVVNGHAQYTMVGSLGSEWTFHG